MRCASLPRLLFTSALCVAVLSGIAVPAASAAVQDRISTAISNSSKFQIPNSVPPKAALAADLGPAPADTKLQTMTLRFSMTTQQETALDQLLADQQNPSSARYHQWLTPAQYAAQFGLSSGDIAKVTAWLTSQGFTVTGVANGGTFVTFDGTAAQAEAAFGTSIHSLSLNGETHFANVTNASVPSAFAGIVGGITGLHNFRPKPRVRTSVVNPRYTSSATGDHYLAPGDIYTLYDMNPLLNNAINGTGQTIAVTGQVDIYLADITAFRNASGLSTINLQTVHEPTATSDPGPPICNSCTTGPNQNDLAESSIDLEWSGAMAPSASILFVNSDDALLISMVQAIDQNLAPIITTSYGECEAGWGSTEMNVLNQSFKQANAQGQTILAAAADQGATDCDGGPSATEGLNVDFPASSPYVTGLGGTTFDNDGNATGATTYWSASNGTTGGSAISYIPEEIWNDYNNNDSALGYVSAFGGGGGGASSFFTKPAWQQGTGVPTDAARDVPDLALSASDEHDPFLFCVNVALGDSCTSGYRVGSSTGQLNIAGGTSFDSQIFGGMLALVEQKTGSRIGNANPVIYALANSGAYYTPGANFSTNPNVVFNDVIAGNNEMPCTAGTPNCTNGGSIGYNAVSGYDLASGWGSVNLYNLANAWNLVTPLCNSLTNICSSGTNGNNTSATSLIATPTSVAAGASVSLTATVTGANGTPTGTVQFLVNNTPAGAPVTVSALSSGVATASYTYVTSCSTLGQQNMSASYSGDTNYAGSKGPALIAGGAGEASNGSIITSPLIVTVTSGTCPDFTVTPSSTTFSVNAGGAIPAVTITVAPINGYTGTVTFSATATSNSGYLPGFSFNPTSVTITSSASATTTLTLTGLTASLRLPHAPGQTGAGTMLARKGSGRMPWYAAGSGVTIASLMLLMLPRRRRLGGLLLVALAVALIGGASGCGGSSQASAPTIVADAGTYSITIVGTSTTTAGQVHITTVTYQIE